MRKKKQNTQALKFLYNAYEYFAKSTNKIDLAETEIYLAKVYLNMNELDSAYKYISGAEKISGKVKNANNLMEVYKTLSDYYEKRGDNGKALMFYKRFVSFRDSIQGEKTQLKIAQLESKYELSKKEKKILKLQLSEKTEKAKNLRLVFVLALTVIVFLSVIAWIIVRRRHERTVWRQKQIIAEKERQFAVSEREKSLLKEKRLEEELQYKTKQLATHSLNMMQKSKLIHDITGAIKKLETTGDCDKQKKGLRQLKMELAYFTNIEKDWGLFKLYFEELNAGFLDRLKKTAPNLTENEIRLSVLIKMNMTLKEMASVLNISPNSVKNARHRLKLKLKLSPEQSLNEFIHDLSGKTEYKH